MYTISIMVLDVLHLVYDYLDVVLTLYSWNTMTWAMYMERQLGNSDISKSRTR